MTQEEQKGLLLRDLCARLPYGVKAEVVNTQGYHHENVAKKGEKTIDTLKGFDSSHNCFTVYHNNPLDWDWTCSEIDIEDIKPYLIPLSNMTEEETKEYKHLLAFSGSPNGAANFIDWLNAHHFDYNGLIPMGLAIEAPEGMYD